MNRSNTKKPESVKEQIMAKFHNDHHVATFKRLSQKRMEEKKLQMQLEAERKAKAGAAFINNRKNQARNKPLNKEGDEPGQNGESSNRETYLDIREKWIKIVHFDMLKKHTRQNQRDQKASFKQLQKDNWGTLTDLIGNAGEDLAREAFDNSRKQKLTQNTLQMKTTHIALGKQKEILKNRLDEIDQKLEQGEKKKSERKLPNIKLNYISGRASPYPENQYQKQANKLGQSVDFATLQTNSPIMKKDWASGQIQTPLNLDASLDAICNTPQIERYLDKSLMENNSVESDLNILNPVINFQTKNLRQTMFQPSPKPLSTQDYNKILTKPTDVKLSSLMKTKIDELGNKLTDEELLKKHQKDLANSELMRKKLQEESRSIFNTSNIFQKSQDQTKMSDASKMSRTSGLGNDSALNAISGALWASQTNNLRASPQIIDLPGLHTHSNFSKSPLQTIQNDRDDPSINAQNLRLSLDSFEFVPEQALDESMNLFDKNKIVTRSFPATVKSRTLKVSPSTSPRRVEQLPPSFVHHTPHNGIKINSGDKKLTIQQRYIDKKYLYEDQAKDNPKPKVKTKSRHVTNRSVVLDPLPKTIGVWGKDELRDFFEEARQNYRKYEYDGPENMARTPVPQYQEKHGSNQRRSKHSKNQSKSVAPVKQPKNTVDPIQQAVKDCAEEYIENELLVGKNNILQTSIISILRQYETDRLNAGGTSIDNTERLMKEFYNYREQGFGPRHHREAMKDFMDLTSTNRKLEKFVAEINQEKLKTMESGAVSRTFRGMKAPGILMQVDRDRWIDKHKLGEKFEAIKEQRNFIKEIFQTIDEDGSGKLEKKEIMKSLLCMGLCKDITFAQRIINVFKARQIEERERINRKKLAKGEVIIDDPNAQIDNYGLRDFIGIFSEDKVGKNVIDVINREIQRNEDQRIRATAQKRFEQSQDQWQKFSDEDIQKQIQAYDQSMAPEIKLKLKQMMSIENFDFLRQEEKKESNKMMGSLRNTSKDFSLTSKHGAIKSQMAKKGSTIFKMNALSSFGKNIHNDILDQQNQLDQMAKKKGIKEQPKLPVDLRTPARNIDENESYSVDLSAESRFLNKTNKNSPGNDNFFESFSSERSEDDFNDTLDDQFGKKSSLKKSLARAIAFKVKEQQINNANPLVRQNLKRTMKNSNLNLTQYKEQMKQQKASLEQKQIENIKKLKNDMQNQMALREMEDQVKESMQSVSKDLGPSIGMQSAIVEGWWKKMAEEYNPNIHHSFVRDIPIKIVTKLLVEKGIVQDEHNANMLYKHDIGDRLIHGANLRMSWEDFMLIVSKRMFRDALLQVTKTIQKISQKQSDKADRDQNLVLNISEYQRRFMINLNTKTDGQDSSVMKSLDFIKQQENMKRKQIRAEKKAKEAHLAEKFKVQRRDKTPESGDEAQNKGAVSGKKDKDEDSDDDDDDIEDTAVRGTANEEIIQQLIGGEAGMIRYKRNLSYDQFMDDPFGLKKRAQQREIQAQRLKQQMIQQALDREERMRSQMANGELANKEGQDSTASAVLDKNNSKIDGKFQIEGDEEEADKVLTLTSSIQKPEIHSDFMAMQTRQILRTNKQHHDIKPIPIDAAGFIVSQRKPSKASKHQMPLVLVPRIYQQYNKTKAQKFMDQTVNLRAYQQSLGQNGIKYKVGKRSQGQAIDIPQTVGDHISENSDLQDRS